MIDLMIDLETLSTEPNAIILQIGMVSFDIETFEPQRSYKWQLPVKSQKDAGRDWSVATLQWWLIQPKELQEEVLLPSFGMTIDQHHDVVLSNFLDAYLMEDGKYGVQNVWAQGCTDFEWLEDMMGRRTPPWQYYQKADCRSVMKAAETYGVDVQLIREQLRLKLKAHNALDDCLIQIGTLREIKKCLKAN
jgi:hypothetical protein